MGKEPCWECGPWSLSPKRWPFAQSSLNTWTRCSRCQACLVACRKATHHRYDCPSLCCRPSTTSYSASCSSSALPSARASSALASHCRASVTAPGPATSPTAHQSCFAGGSGTSPLTVPSSCGPSGGSTLVFLCSNDDRAPAWSEDFANGLLSAQKLTAALIVLHTGEDSVPLRLLTGEAPRWEARLWEALTPHWLIFLVFISITHVHRTKPLWRKSPLTNLWWAVTVPVV